MVKIHETPEDKTTYETWQAMKRRCDNPNAQNYYLYGGRGITYQESWKKYVNFLNDMGLKRNKEYSLERIDNSLGYSKENCKWASKWEQARNKRNNIFMEFNGHKKTLSEWSRDTGIKLNTIHARITYYGWTVEQALTTPAVVGRNQTWKS